MSTTPEGRVKAAIKKLLDGYPGLVYYHMPVQNGMGRPTLDFVGCCAAHYFAIEAKSPGKIPTPRQKLTIETMEKSKAAVFVIDEPSGPEINDLKEWIERTIKAFTQEHWGEFGSADDS